MIASSLQVLFTTEERERILLEALVLGLDGTPTNIHNLVDAAFPLARPDWDWDCPPGGLLALLPKYPVCLFSGLFLLLCSPTTAAKILFTFLSCLLSLLLHVFCLLH